MKIKVPIWYYSPLTEAQRKLQEAGVEDIPTERELREQVFYNVDSLAPYPEGGSLIYSGGDTFISPEPVHKVERLIDESNVRAILPRLCN